MDFRVHGRMMTTDCCQLPFRSSYIMFCKLPALKSVAFLGAIFPMCHIMELDVWLGWLSQRSTQPYLKFTCELPILEGFPWDRHTLGAILKMKIEAMENSLSRTHIAGLTLPHHAAVGP